MLLAIAAVVSCAPQEATVSPVPGDTPAPAATATPPPPTPAPGHSLILRAYLRAVRDGILVDYVRRLELNRTLLSNTQSRGLDADVLCADTESSSSFHFWDLGIAASLLEIPPEAAGFHSRLLEALEVAEATAQSRDWLCETYLTFGQPAEGMWGRMIQQVSACRIRAEELRADWRDLSEDDPGLAW